MTLQVNFIDSVYTRLCSLTMLILVICNDYYGSFSSCSLSRFPDISEFLPRVLYVYSLIEAFLNYCVVFVW